MLCLGIESSCDETAIAIVDEHNEILANCIFSQLKTHEAYGGVVPEIASRQHLDRIFPLLQEALKKANISLSDIDLIAATKGPGLMGSLLIGLNVAKTLAYCLNKPFIGVNHLEAHLHAATMLKKEDFGFPALGVLLSGGHTHLMLMQKKASFELISHTVDDAIGEAFDKAAVLLGLPYPGGPCIERLTKNGDPSRFSLKAGTVKNKPLHFSFSGLKTSFLYTLKGPKSDKHSLITLDKSLHADLAACFQKAAFDDVIKKSFLAAKKYAVKSILFGGGVTQNQYLREQFSLANKDNHPLLWPDKDLCLDNAAMIAGLGLYYHIYHNKQDSLDLEALTHFSKEACH